MISIRACVLEPNESSFTATAVVEFDALLMTTFYRCHSRGVDKCCPHITKSSLHTTDIRCECKHVHRCRDYAVVRNLLNERIRLDEKRWAAASSARHHPIRKIRQQNSTSNWIGNCALSPRRLAMPILCTVIFTFNGICWRIATNAYILYIPSHKMKEK